jgi:uncharacterized protein YndB with AHSA1/START domain
MIIVYILIVIVLIILVLGMIAPNDYKVERTVVIDKPRDVVFNKIKYLKNHDEWSPWAHKDPDMKKEFRGEDGEVGFVSAWEGNKDVGSGEQEIKKLVENERLESELRFLKPFKSTSDAYVNLTDVDGGTEVAWGFTGSNKFPINIMMMFMNMDKTVGKDFQEGLGRLKDLLEK